MKVLAYIRFYNCLINDFSLESSNGKYFLTHLNGHNQTQ